MPKSLLLSQLGLVEIFEIVFLRSEKKRKLNVAATILGKLEQGLYSFINYAEYICQLFS